MDEKFIKRYESFKKSLEALKEAEDRDPSDSFVLSGTAAKFTIAYELAWKVMKDVLIQYYGISDFVVGSPKEVLRKGFQTELIAEEEMWLEIHNLRNQIAHTYEDTELLEYYHQIVSKYIKKFEELKQRIEELPAIGL